MLWFGLNKNQMIKSKYLLKLKYLGISMAIFGYLFKFLSLQGAKVLFAVGLCLVGIYFLESRGVKSNYFREDLASFQKKIPLQQSLIISFV